VKSPISNFESFERTSEHELQSWSEALHLAAQLNELPEPERGLVPYISLYKEDKLLTAALTNLGVGARRVAHLNGLQGEPPFADAITPR